MGKLLLALVPLAVVTGAYHLTIKHCRRSPTHRWSVAVLSVVAMASAAALVPWLLEKLNPPWSESPAGIFVYLGKALVVGGLALGGLGSLVGAIMARRRADLP